MQPPAVYSIRPVSTSVFEPKRAHNLGKIRFVSIIKSDGILIIICTNSGFSFIKYCFMLPRAGATAAPAITVRSESESMLTVNFFKLFCCSILQIPPIVILEKNKSASPFGLTLLLLNEFILPK